VAWTTHWECHICPETRSSWLFYADWMGAILANFRAQGWKVIGHGHPRDERARVRWEHLGVEWEPSDSGVFNRASLLIADNTSLMYEFASLGRPVLALNAPWYRRDVEHGLRFWSHCPGQMIDHPEQLLRFDLDQYVYSAEAEMLRSAAVAEAYAHVDGHAATRAASFIVDIVERYG
jgi:CDP-glycerol glycerophosphotransferase (TagB/SpsB family)